MTMPRTKKELTDAVYRTLPTSLVQPCVVRSKVEDPTVLLERQQLQQTKSIHELSKIRNLNEMPIPGNVFKLPDVPLPKAKSILNYIARPAPRTPRTPNGTKSETYHSYESAQSETVESTPLTDDKVFHSMSNGNESPTGSISNDHELGYEVITKTVTPDAPQIVATPPQEFKEIEPERLPTPPPEEIPPPLPPKRLTPSPKKGMSLETQPSFEEEEIEAIPVKGILTLEAVDGNIQ